MRLRFEECADRPKTEVIGFGSQNAIWEIVWTHEDDAIRAEFHSVASDWGVDGRIQCRRAIVLEALVIDESP